MSGGEPGDEASAFIRERKGEGESGRRGRMVVRREGRNGE